MRGVEGSRGKGPVTAPGGRRGPLGQSLEKNAGQVHALKGSD